MTSQRCSVHSPAKGPQKSGAVSWGWVATAVLTMATTAVAVTAGDFDKRRHAPATFDLKPVYHLTRASGEMNGETPTPSLWSS